MDFFKSVEIASLLVQFLAVILALRLIPITGKRKAWLSISLATLLMAIRRAISLFGLDMGGFLEDSGLIFELVGFGTSLLMAFGIASIGPFFLSIRRSEEALRKAKDELEQRVEERTSDLVKANKQLCLEMERRKWELTVNSALSEIYRPLIAPSSSFESIAFTILDQAKNLTRSADGYVSSIGMHSSTNDVYAPVVMIEAEFDKLNNTQNMDSNQKCKGIFSGALMSIRKALFTNSPQTHPGLDNLIGEYPSIHCLLLMPVMIGKNFVGQIALVNKDEDYTESDLEAVRRLAEFYALAIQRMHVEKELLRTSTLLEETFASITSSVFVLEPSSRKIIKCNPVVGQMFGYSEQELVGKTTECLHIDSKSYKAFVEAANNSLKEKGVYTTEYQLRRKDGTAFFTNHTITEILDGFGRQSGWVSLVRDITQRKLAEQELERISRQNKLILDSAGEGIFGLDRESRVTFVNPAASRMFGLDVDELIGRVMHSVTHHSKPDGIAYPLKGCQICAALHDGEVHRGSEEAFWKKDGTSFPIEYVSTPIMEKGQGIGIVVVFKDITERKRAEEERETTINLLRLLNTCNNTRELAELISVFLKNWSGCDAVGIRLRDGKDFPFFASKGFTGDFLKSENNLLGLNSDGELRRDKDGVPILECLCGSIVSGRFDPSKPFFTEEGSFWTNSSFELLASLRDSDLPTNFRKRCITEGYESIALVPLKTGGESFGLLQLNDKKKGYFTPELVVFLERLAGNIAKALARRKAEEERRRLMSAVKQAAEAIIITDINGMIQYVNPAVEKITGYSSEETLGRHRKMLLRGNEEYGRICDKIERGEVWKGRAFNKRKNGSALEVEGTVSPVFDRMGQIINYVALYRDATHEAQIERQLRQAQKMEAIGVLAGGVAHDFNNILGAILASAEMAKEDIPKESPVQLHIDRMLKASYRAKDLVKQILTFSRKTEKKLIPVEVGILVKEVLKLLRASFPSTIEIQYKASISPEASPGRVMADPTQIHQVLMNLCTNAAHAMREKGGVLGVGLEDVNLGSDDVCHLHNIPPGYYLKLTVRDTGHGIDPSSLQRIFDPFFTTKGPGEGTGMGLSVVHGIVTSCGGAITVESVPGKGSAFDIYLPRITVLKGHPGEISGDSRGITPSSKGRERILFVDDEEDLTLMWAEILGRLDYETIVTTSGVTALDLFRAEPDSFDLVITDQTMPKMLGVEVAARVLAIRSDIPVILCTGNSEAVSEGQILALGIRKLVLKPVDKQEMAKAIRDVLDVKKPIYPVKP